MGEIKDMGERLERWTEAHRTGDVVVKVSSHGRLMLRFEEEMVVMTCIESMQLLRGILQAYTTHGFNTPEPNHPIPTKGSR